MSQTNKRYIFFNKNIEKVKVIQVFLKNITIELN